MRMLRDIVTRTLAPFALGVVVGSLLVSAQDVLPSRFTKEKPAVLTFRDHTIVSCVHLVSRPDYVRCRKLDDSENDYARRDIFRVEWLPRS